MKKLSIIIIIIIIAFTSCGNPYTDPETSKALSQDKQVELMKEHNKKIDEQNKQLKRIADALENLKK